jgi:hypothetical protein
MIAPPLARILQDPAQARAFLSRIIDPDCGVAEIRVLDADYDKRRGTIEPEDRFPKTIVGWFDDVDSALNELKKLWGVSPYITLNPVSRALLARANNRLKVAGKKGGTTSDQQIVCLRWFFVDIDPVRPTLISSTDEELAAAIERRDAILGDHPDIKASSLWGRSGNGAWILVRLPDYPNDDAHKDLLARAVAHLGERYSDDVVSIDVATKNASRIMCIPGCLKAKGDSILERPHRLATIEIETEVAV